jgi:hypothetical protein
MMAGHGQLLRENKAVKEFNDVHPAHLSETFRDFPGIFIHYQCTAL